ncbi:mitochondrial protease Sdd3 [Schizosaccharomyces osmophilus]|uniref:Mitochondrial protease Sdd3 n=1 Tax=Schizosaccharomyces osmophilus TaxID=2545709 RepID=A0AAE9WG25_9SCHI|nr:mitochondrial protease Sdd3 [Schizosaccharomyces osmophilus]WBW74562.1 mitochondrial protease Sdd3 [Schizosaccharomyces osmophilus]
MVSKKSELEFRQIASERLLNYEVKKWTNDATGFTVACVNTPTTRVNGSFVVATEAHDNSGCPHTLEHLCFMGSKKYPMNGILTNFAGRACGDINAYTDVDSTVYELSSAEEDGFLRLLPVFADHVLFPLLSEDAFCTEVYHTNQFGEESGVVYSEMQDSQTSEVDVMFDCIRTNQYPPSSGYFYETGGHPDELRKLSIQQIRDYHKAMYVPSNICLVVAGSIEEERLLETSSSIVRDIIDNDLKTPEGWVRPWSQKDSTTQIPNSLVKSVNFSSEDESTGSLSIAWNGPSLLDQFKIFAIQTICDFLSESAVSPLKQAFVEIEDPFCSFIYFYVFPKDPCSIQLFLDSIPVEKIDGLVEKVLSLLSNLQTIDMKRLHDYLDTQKNQYLTALEVTPRLLFTKVLTLDHVYGNRDGSDISKFMEGLSYNEELKKWSEKDWINLIRSTFIESHSISVLALPSYEMAERVKQETNKTLSDRVNSLGKEGLEAIKHKLDSAKAKNEQKLPYNLVSSFKITDPSQIHFYNSTTAKTKWSGQDFENDVQKYINSDGEDLPLYVQFDHIDSSFVSIVTYFDTADIPPALKQYLSVFAKYILAAPAELENLGVISHEEVVKRLERDTVLFDASLLFDKPSCSYSYYETKRELFYLECRVTRENYQKGIYWIGTLLTATLWDKNRLLSIINQLLADIPYQKRDAECVLPSYIDIRLYNENSLKYTQNTLTQEKVLRELRQKLIDSPAEVFSSFDDLRNHLLKSLCPRVHVIGDILQTNGAASLWTNFVSQILRKKTSGSQVPTSFSRLHLQENEFKPHSSLTVIPMPSNESSDLVIAIPGIKSWNDPNLPVVVLIANYLGLMDGPFWNRIRGSGLAYGFNMGIDIDGGLLFYSILTSSDVYRAWSSSKDLLSSILSGKVSVNSFDLESAKCMAYSTVSELENNAFYSAKNSFTLLSIKNLRKEWDRLFLERIAAVTIDEFMESLKKFCLPFFSPENNLAVLTSSLSRLDQTVSEFQSEGFDVSVKSIHEIQGLEPSSDEEEESEEDGETGSTISEEE